MADHDDLEALLGKAGPKPDALAELLHARLNAPPELAEPGIIPTPEFLPGGVVRFNCVRGCGWHYDENPGLDAAREPMSLRVPGNWTQADLTAAVTAHADERSERTRARIEAAITAHHEEAHSSPAGR
ncbi:hypothetical protein [Streptomyces sp. BH104]|uniref:hypothetical protein n=1 Tax=Streptomyces sp. BH104 TaxID=3410407 RepID=UPI003BB7237F